MTEGKKENGRKESNSSRNYRIRSDCKNFPYSGIPFKENVEIVAVSDANEAAAQRLAEDFDIPAYYQDSTRMLREVKPDVVSICVPNKFHYPLTIEALNAGCHVFCEKPPAMNPKEALEMWQLAERMDCSLPMIFISGMEEIQQLPKKK